MVIPLQRAAGGWHGVRGPARRYCLSQPSTSVGLRGVRTCPAVGRLGVVLPGGPACLLQDPPLLLGDLGAMGAGWRRGPLSPPPSCVALDCGYSDSASLGRPPWATLSCCAVVWLWGCLPAASIPGRQCQACPGQGDPWVRPCLGVCVLLWVGVGVCWRPVLVTLVLCLGYQVLGGCLMALLVAVSLLFSHSVWRTAGWVRPLGACSLPRLSRLPRSSSSSTPPQSVSLLVKPIRPVLSLLPLK